MKSSLSVRSLKRLCVKGIIPPCLYWTIRRIRKKKSYIYKRRQFDLRSLDDEECLHMFRFSRAELVQLLTRLRIPCVVRLLDRSVFRGIEVLCIMLRRLAYPNRFRDLSRIFYREPTSISRVTTWMFIYVFNHTTNTELRR